MLDNRMKIQTDLKYIKRMGVENGSENRKFRAFLKQFDLSSREMDRHVHRITAEITAQIDCTKCANCCKQIRPVLDEDDILRFSNGIGLTIQEFESQYIQIDESDPFTYTFKKLPCPFLTRDLCTNYDHRPAVCHSYPHLQKAKFRSRLLSVIENYEICPIVFNVYER